MKRKPIPKEMRQSVYEKYQGHCAYCGKKLNIGEMQVDHAIPLAGVWYGKDRKKVADMIEDGSINNIENLMPACRACNYYKGVGDIERFRDRIKNELDHTCRGTFQARLAIQFGIIEYHQWDGKFYFEKMNQNEKDNVQ